MPLNMKELSAALERGDNITAIPPLENYKPTRQAIGTFNEPGILKMSNIAQRDSKNFSQWMQDAGGFHYDDALGKFVPDLLTDESGPLDAVAKRTAGVLMNPSQILSNLGQAVKSSYPVVRNEFTMDKLRAAPGNALQDLAHYERENPLGSALGFMGNVVAGRGARGFKQAETLGRVFGGAVDNLPRFEINDAESVLKGLPKAMQESRLEDVLDHPELYQNYPELAELKVKKIIPTLQNFGERGSFNPKTGEIMVEAGDEAKSTLLHEIQHAIQEKENFARGGRPEDFKGLTYDELMEKYKPLFRTSKYPDTEYILKEINDKSFNKYGRLGGEVEARNVQGRMNMTEAERRARPFNETFDVPIEQQILRREGGGTPSSLIDFLTEMERMKS